MSVNGSTATVDLSKEVEQQAGGSFGENGEFKALVYTMTGIRGIDAVQITVDGSAWRRCQGDILNLMNRFIARTGKPRGGRRLAVLGRCRRFRRSPTRR